MEMYCLNCGKLFDGFYSGFCSLECEYDFKNANSYFMYCNCCGQIFIRDKFSPHQKFCSVKCRSKMNTLKRKDIAKNVAKERKSRIKYQKRCSKKTLEQWAREADECGMSYGKYRHAVEKLGKTFEELKTDYERRKIGD